ncbi:hypothetical protein IV38_GL001026 [Lactobacillus selangorensis]|uniref:Uncharacterized protein n=2 Tax=Lactobacillus selangorensis TaxID=81857 RepID=A0A0R2FVE5_9LACO|nr:hypothetical protein IV38_GL001026 [Lactobacillus selangorensis]KRN32770.1 hypothetical protein IV40_GL000828 [Lactobacillus selangorensis]
MQQHGFLFSVCEWTLLLVFNYTTGVSGDLLLILMVPNLIITALYMKIHRVYGALLTILGVLMILENF